MRLVLAIVTVVSTVGFNFHVLLPLLASETLQTGPGGVRDPLRVRSAAARSSARCSRPRSAARAGRCSCSAPAASASRCSRSRRSPPSGPARPPLRHGHLLHALDVERELDPPARRARPPARPRRQPLSLGLRRPRPARRAARGLARRVGGTELSFTVAGVDRPRDDRARRHGSWRRCDGRGCSNGVSACPVAARRRALRESRKARRFTPL